MSFAVQCKASSEAIVKEVAVLYEKLAPLANGLALEWESGKEEESPRAVVDRLTPLVKQAEAVEALFPPLEKAVNELSQTVAPLARQFEKDLAALRELADKLRAAQQ